MLYKYLTFDQIDVLRKGLIRLTQPSDFNDPFELRPSFDLMSKADIAALPDAPAPEGYTGQPQKLLTPEALQRMFAVISPGMQRQAADFPNDGGSYAFDNNMIAQHTFDSRYGILSLSETHNNVLMWSHYADQHRGFVIQFDESHPFFKGEFLEDGTPRLTKVDYNERRPILSYSTINSPQVYFRKSPAWSYEREWRLIRPLIEASQIINKSPNPVHLFSVPTDSITAVITGALMDRQRLSEYRELCLLCSETPELRHIKIHHMQLSRDMYELTTSPRIDGVVDQAALNGRALEARDFSV